MPVSCLFGDTGWMGTSAPEKETHHHPPLW